MGDSTGECLPGEVEAPSSSPPLRD